MHLTAVVLFSIALCGAETEVLNKADCSSTKEIWMIHLDAHNGLRNRSNVASMIYDCELEKFAAYDQFYPGHIKYTNYSSIQFYSNSTRNQSEMLKCAYSELETNEIAIVKMTNPEATKFGCSTLDRSGMMNVTCIYNKLSLGNQTDLFELRSTCNSATVTTAPSLTATYYYKKCSEAAMGELCVMDVLPTANCHCYCH